MYKVVQTCANCGADLTIHDMRGPSCPYCKVVYPHHSQAVQHAQVVQQVMGNMMAARPPVGAPPVGAPPVVPLPGTSPYGQPPPPPAWGYDAMVQQQLQHAQQISRRITNIVLVSLIASFLLAGLIAVAVIYAR